MKLVKDIGKAFNDNDFFGQNSTARVVYHLKKTNMLLRLLVIITLISLFK